MRRFLAVLCGVAILACAPATTLAAPPLAEAADLRAEAARAARAGGPLIVIYSRADCKYCQTVKRDYLQPLAADPQRGKRVVIREIRQDAALPLRDFAGRPTDHASFTGARGIRLVPVVAFYGPDGRELAEPLVGAGLPDFYQSYLDDAIAAAARRLARP